MIHRPYRAIRPTQPTQKLSINPHAEAALARSRRSRFFIHLGGISRCSNANFLAAQKRIRSKNIVNAIILCAAKTASIVNGPCYVFLRGTEGILTMRRNIGAFSYDETNAVDPFCPIYTRPALRAVESEPTDISGPKTDSINLSSDSSSARSADTDQKRSNWPLSVRFAIIVGLSLTLWGGLIGAAVLLFI